MRNTDISQRRRGLRLNRAQTRYLLRLGLLVAALGFVAWVYGGDVYVLLALAVCAVGIFARGIAPGLIPELLWIMVRVPFVLGIVIPAWRAVDALFRANAEDLAWAGVTVLLYGLAVWTLIRLPLGMRRPFVKWLPDGALSPRARAETAAAREVGTTRGYGVGGAGYSRSTVSSSTYGSPGASADVPGTAAGASASRYGSAAERMEPSRSTDQQRHGLFERGRQESAARSPSASTTGPYTTSTASMSAADRPGTTSSRYGAPGASTGVPDAGSGATSSRYGTPGTSTGTPGAGSGATSSRYGTSGSRRYGAASEGERDGTPGASTGVPGAGSAASSRYGTSGSRRYGAASEGGREGTPGTSTGVPTNPPSRYGASRYGTPPDRERAAPTDTGSDKKRRGLFGRGRPAEPTPGPTSRYGTPGTYGTSAKQEPERKRRGLFGRGRPAEPTPGPTSRYGDRSRQGPFTFSEPEAADPRSEEKRGGRFRRGRQASEVPAEGEVIPLPPPAAARRPFTTASRTDPSRGFLAALDAMDDDSSSTASVNPFTTNGAAGFLSALDPPDEDSPENQELRRMHEERLTRLQRLEELKAKIDKKLGDQ